MRHKQTETHSELVTIIRRSIPLYLQIIFFADEDTFIFFFFFFQAEDGIRDFHVTGVQTCALPISPPWSWAGCSCTAHCDCGGGGPRRWPCACAGSPSRTWRCSSWQWRRTLC